MLYSMPFARLVYLFVSIPAWIPFVTRSCILDEHTQTAISCLTLKISTDQKEIFDSQLPHSVAFRNVWLTCFIHISLSGSVKPDLHHLNMECILKRVYYIITFFESDCLLFFVFDFCFIHYDDLYSQKWFVNLFTILNTYNEMYIV